MNENKTLEISKLEKLVKSKSKHSDYQLLHPSLLSLISNDSYSPIGKNEYARFEYIKNLTSLNEKNVLDIGANTGFFSLASIDAGAKKVVSQEGNREHADFLSLGARCLGIEDKLEVRPYYYDFFAPCVKEKFDVIFCLNVLHHLGDDFGDSSINLDSAKKEILNSLNNLANKSKYCFMQLGFNWKGDKNIPLFKYGKKIEIIDFIQQGTKNFWTIENIAVMNFDGDKYIDINEESLVRFDNLGEFSNRPLFFLKSCILK